MPESEDNKTIKQMRAKIRRLEKQVEQERHQAEDETRVSAKYVLLDVVGAFRSLGLPAEAGVLYLRGTNLDEVSAESIAEFVSSYGDAWRKPADPDEEEAEHSQGFTPFLADTNSFSTTVSMDDFRQKLKNGDYEGVKRDLEAGRVEKPTLPGQRPE